jgi:CelD/BcsL family acetyltransferase involved in cellulose biosynthesis
VAPTTGKATPEGLETCCITDFAEMQGLKAEWTTLAKSSAPDNFFASWQFATAWWEAYGKDAELFIIVCRDEDGITGIAPLYSSITAGPAGSRFRTLKLIGDGSDDADGFQFLLRTVDEAECIESIFNCLWQHEESWDLLEFNSLPEEINITQNLIEHVHRSDLSKQLCWRPHLVIELPESWEVYLQQLRPKARKNLLREIHKWEAAFKLQLRQCNKADEVPAFLELAMDLHQANWRVRGKAGKLALESRRNFYFALCERAFAAETLDLWLLEADGKPCASLVGFKSGNSRYELLPGREPAFDSFSPGVVIHALVLRESIRRRVTHYDFLSGADFYKRRLGAVNKRYLDLRVARPRTRAGLWLTTKNSSNASKTWLRGNMPTVFRALKRISGRG